MAGTRRLDVEARRAQILDAARAAFAAAPYSEVSTAQIARASGSSQALLFHYFGTKADLYAVVAREAIDALTSTQLAANEALPAGVPVRDRVKVSLETYLDYIHSHPESWATPLRGGAEPEAVVAMRAEARAANVDRLATLLGVHGWTRHTYALWGFLGFLDQACLHWVDQGCPADQRNPLIDAALGALEGALGDWKV